jgi:NAD-specific glutamate dehydrogenase
METDRFAAPVRALLPRLPSLLRGWEAEETAARAGVLAGRGVPREAAARFAALPHGHGLLDVVEVAGQGARLPIDEVAGLYYALSARRTGPVPVNPVPVSPG